MRPVSTHSQRVLILTCRFRRVKPDMSVIHSYFTNQWVARGLFIVNSASYGEFTKSFLGTFGRQRSDFNSRKKGNPLRSQKHLRHQFSWRLILSFFLEQFQDWCVRSYKVVRAFRPASKGEKKNRFSR